MKALLLFLLLAPVVYAAPPPCFPGEPTAFEKDLQIAHTAEGCIAYVHCDVGHKWVQYSMVGNLAKCKAAEAAMTVMEWMNLSHEAKTSAYDAFMTTATADPEDAVLLTKATTIQHPADAPPSGLVTTDTKAYKLSSAVNATPTFALVGTIALDITCDTSQKFGPYYRVDRNAAKFPKGVLLPLTVFAKCD